MTKFRKIAKYLLSISVVTALSLCFMGCHKQTTTIETVESIDEIIEESSNDATEDEVDFKNQYSPYQVYTRKDSINITDTQPYVAPANVDNYVGYYEIIPHDSVDKDTETEKRYLEIKENGYYTLYKEDIFTGIIHQENVKYIQSDDSYVRSDELTKHLRIESGVLTSEFTTLKLRPISIFSNYTYDFNLEWVYDMEGKRETLAFTAGEVKKDDDGNLTVSNVPLLGEMSYTIYIGPYSDFSGTVTAVDNGEIVFEDNSQHATRRFKKTDDIPEYVKRSVFQQYYDWLENYDTKFKNKNEFLQALRTEGIQTKGDKALDDEFLSKKGYTASGEKIQMKYLFCPGNSYADCYGYDGNKVYKGDLNENADIIEWEEMTLNTEAVKNAIANH
ncbi:hypothetical protein [Streptococcus merionis]|uniref:Lipoprotein n=1 Tax=Streptococcus merionis TaxID=400065 RepID=A0A239SPD5_9STRE|nr:hypothetical protein [Streptococcus merionis]SNU87325.1 Uncharacterised protein [Streptococcus merionis]